MSDMIEVSQAARDAAADLYQALFPENDLRAVNVRLGNIDDGVAVQAFARFERERIQAHTAALADGAGEIAAELVICGEADRTLAHQAAATIAALRAELARVKRSSALSDLIADDAHLIDGGDDGVR